MQKTRGQYCQLSDADYGWLFIWDNFGHDPATNEWRKQDENNLFWRRVPQEEVPANILESALIFFEKSVRV